MNDRAHALIEAAARELADKAHTQEDLHNVLFTLVRECYLPLPERLPVVPIRRMPAAGEILPPQQRATWARGKTVYDGDLP